MAVYVVIADPAHDKAVEIAIKEKCSDRQPVRPGVWLIRTKDKTGSEASSSLGIGGQRNALIVPARYISGWFDSEVIERLGAWDEDQS